MIYEYYCEKCEEIIQLEMSMKDNIPKALQCEKCNNIASRVYNNVSIHIPEFMKATSNLYNSNDGSNLDYIKNRMNHGTRPSGKDKTIY